MPAPLQIDVVTIFPGMLTGFLGESMIKRAVAMGAVRITAVDLRAFTHDVHRTTDDRPYGGGPGMVMKPEPIFDAVEAVRRPETRVLMMTPEGRVLNQAMVQALARETHLVLICGHYEGVDERVRTGLAPDEISIGDYVLTNGVLPAAVVVDAVVRLLPGVLGAGPEAHQAESFSSGMLDYPQYTRPPTYRGMEVPAVLLSGDHQAVARWRAEQARERTRQRRPDLLEE
jgi:tRNA (guanine37-N1)-methyltransferase